MLLIFLITPLLGVKVMVEDDPLISDEKQVVTDDDQGPSTMDYGGAVLDIFGFVGSTPTPPPTVEFVNLQLVKAKGRTLTTAEDVVKEERRGPSINFAAAIAQELKKIADIAEEHEQLQEYSSGNKLREWDQLKKDVAHSSSVPELVAGLQALDEYLDISDTTFQEHMAGLPDDPDYRDGIKKATMSEKWISYLKGLTPAHIRGDIYSWSDMDQDGDGCLDAPDQKVWYSTVTAPKPTAKPEPEEEDDSIDGPGIDCEEPEKAQYEAADADLVERAIDLKALKKASLAQKKAKAAKAHAKQMKKLSAKAAEAHEKEQSLQNEIESLQKELGLM